MDESITQTAKQIASDGEPTLRQLRYARFGDWKPVANTQGIAAHTVAKLAKQHLRRCHGDHDSDLDDALTNIARSLVVSRLVDQIIDRLVLSGYQTMAEITPQLIGDVLQGQEQEWLHNEGVRGEALLDALGILLMQRQGITLYTGTPGQPEEETTLEESTPHAK